MGDADLSGVAWMCRRCGCSLDEDHPDRRESSVRRRCATCGWINVAGSGRIIDIELADMGEQIPAVFGAVKQPTTGSSDEVARWVKQLRDRLVSHVGSAIAEDQATAVTWLLAMFDGLDKQDEKVGFDGFPIFVLQHVYLHFLVRGGVPVSTARVQDLSGFWQEDVWTICMWSHLLSEALREAALGRDLHIENGHLIVVSEDEAESWARDVNANQRQWEPSWDRVREAMHDPSVQDAERCVFGVSVSDVLELVIATAEFRRYARVTRGRDYWIVDLGPDTPPQLREVFGRFTLTRRRLGQQHAPDFLYLPDSPILRDTATALAESATFDWLTFAPLMLGTYQQGSEVRPVAIVSKYLVERAMLKAYTGAARRLAVADQASKQLEPQIAKEVSGLRLQFHRRLEIRVADALREAKMVAVQGLEDIDGKRLDCGEIDVLAAGPSTDGDLIVVICEVKDTDLSFFKDYGPREALQVARRAHAQARRKAVWVAENWPQLRQLFGAGAAGLRANARFVALTVPRITALPLGEGAASVPYLELGQTADKLLAEPLDNWRPDLQRAVVVPTAVGA